MSALQLYTPLSDPPFSVVVLHKVVFCKCGYIGKGQPGEGCEDKNVAHQCQAGDGEFFLHDAFQFRIGQEYGVCFVLCHLVAVERVLAHPFLGQCHVRNPFETFHVTDNRVPAETGFRFQVKVECGNKIGIQLKKRNVLFLVKVGNGFFQLAHHIDVTVDGYRGIVYVYGLFHFFDFFTHCTEEGTHFRIFSEYSFQEQSGGNQCKLEFQFLVLLQGQCVEFGDVGVQLLGGPVLSFAAFFGGVPQLGRNAPLYSDFLIMSVNGYAHEDGRLTVFQKFRLQNEEQNVHCSLFHTRFLLVVEHILLCQPERGGRYFSVAFMHTI